MGKPLTYPCRGEIRWCATCAFTRGALSILFLHRLLAAPPMKLNSGVRRSICFGAARRGCLKQNRDCELTQMRTDKHQKTPVSSTRAGDFAYCQDTLNRRNDQWKDGVRIRQMSEHVAPAGILMRDAFFEGGHVLHCYRGSFLFKLEGLEPIRIGEEETVVVYPGQYVTIEALDAANLLVYVIFEGGRVASYFDQIGFFNGIHGPTSSQIEVFRQVKHRLEANESSDQEKLLNRLSDALVTYAHDLRIGANALIGDAIRQIRANLTRKIVRLTPLYEQLHIGHTALSQAFREAGLGSPAQIIRREQLRLVTDLLKTTRKPIAEIAAETGFISVTHFANFVRRNAGMTARDIRRGGTGVKSRREP